MKGFSNFLIEAEEKKKEELQTDQRRVSDDIVTTFGRFNPPHKGHLKAMDHADKLAGSIGDKSPADQRFYASRSHDPKKNPLEYGFKVQQLQKMFPKHAKKWDTDEGIRTVLNAAEKAGKQGYKNFHFVGGQDRRQGMEDVLRKYNGQLYNFDNIYSHSAGDRDEQSEDPIARLSASGQRKYAMDDDFDGFKGGLDINDGYTEEDARQLFLMLRHIMATKNESVWQVDYRSNRDLICEKYRDGELFQRGDLVESLSTGLRGTVHRCGANHLICVTENGIMWKSFVYDVHKV
ncbi:cytidylyltransferase [Synechococcus phage MA10]|uniref:Cytidylyltransferase n=1 Tax=Synechococcus phage S-H34 TaxID=2718942 RepID=A0A6G8R683_9CAUD|nr:cytidyltransferase [Synechococcus phage S-H34]QIN96883.1 cytidylyltransferase [Synechococcus phage S-H34]